jgi:hypothetical protein
MFSILSLPGKGFDQTGLYEKCITTTIRSAYYLIIFEIAGTNEANPIFMRYAFWIPAQSKSSPMSSI